MKSNIRTIVIMSAFSCLATFQSCKKDDNATTSTTTTNTTPDAGLTYTSTGLLTINFNHKYKNEALQLAPYNYITDANDTIRITELTYFITNITLTTKNGTHVNLGNANLISFLPPNPSVITLNNIPTGNYTAISFLIGVDSARNNDQIQGGDLDPSNGMFWTWNTGYIFYRCKGRFGASESNFSFDIGGRDNLMTKTLSLVSFQKSGTAATVNINVDLYSVFNTPQKYDLKVDETDIHNPFAPGIAKFKVNIPQAFSVLNIQ